MAYIYYNPNPNGNRVGDCVVRAISKAMDCSWETAYISLCAEGMDLRDMPSANYVWGTYLLKNGFTHHLISCDCPMCISVYQFADNFPEGTYVLATDKHVVTVIDRDYFDSWDSGNEIVLSYFYKEL